MDLAFFTFSVYLPSKSVMVPLVVPFSMILAPMIGSPFLSFTTPLTVTVCCCTISVLIDSVVSGVAHTLLTPAPAVRKRQVVAFSKALLNKARFSCVFIIQFYLKGLYVHSVYFPFNHPSRSSFLQLCCNFKPLCFDRVEIQTIIAIFFYSIFSQRLYLFPTFAFFII